MTLSESGSTGHSKVGIQECDLRSLEKVREIFRSLSKYLSGKQIYSSNNPNLAKFAVSFKVACNKYFEEEDELLLKVDQYRITWCGQVVYENRKRDESIAFLLYKDGVGEIGIRSGVGLQELERFVDIIKDEMHNYSPEVDIVTRMWRADFENIHYRIFDNDLSGILGDNRGSGFESPGEYIEADDHEDIPSFTDRGRIVAGSYVPDESIGEYVNRIVAEKYRDAGEQVRESHVQAMLTARFTLSDDERDYFRKIIEKERNTDKLIYFIEEILEFVRIPGSSTVAGDVQGVIECLMQHLLNEADVQVLTRTLGTIKEFTDTHAISDNCLSFFKHVEEMFAGNSMLRSLGRVAKTSRKDLENVLRYCRLVGERALPALCEMLEDSSAEWFHDEVCRTIIAVAGEKIHHIIDQLNMDKPHIAQDIVYMYNELQLNAVPSMIHELAYYPDANVRGQVIRLLVRIGNDEAAALLTRLLDDEDMHTRVKSLSAVEEFRNPIIVEKIVSLATDPDLELKGMEEQERTFRALGKLAGDRALPLIEDSIRKRSKFLFKKAPDKRKKVLAIRALEHIKCPKSTSLLGMLAHDKDESVRTAAQRVLEAL
jgi:hypothetical protein